MIIIDLVGRLATQSLMRSSLIVERQIPLQPLLGRADVVIRVQVDLLLFQALPESLHEHIIATTTFAVDADLNAMIVQEARELLAVELTSLIGVENLGTAILRDGLLHGVEAEVCRQRIGQPPGQHPAAGPVQDGEEIHKASPHRNVDDIGCPHVIRPSDRQLA